MKEYEIAIEILESAADTYSKQLALEIHAIGTDDYNTKIFGLSIVRQIIRDMRSQNTYLDDRVERELERKQKAEKIIDRTKAKGVRANWNKATYEDITGGIKFEK